MFGSDCIVGTQSCDTTTKQHLGGARKRSQVGHNEIGVTKVLQSVLRLGARPRIRGTDHVCEMLPDLHTDRFPFL